MHLHFPVRRPPISPPTVTRAPLWIVGMMPSSLPAEIVQKILHEIGDDKRTNFKAGLLSKFWLLQQRSFCLKNLQFRGEGDIVAFSDLISAPKCTFPFPITCEEVSLLDLTAMTCSGAVAALTSRISPPQSLTIDIGVGNIPEPVKPMIVAWKNNLCILKISKGNHNPHAFFDILSGLPHLKALTLEDLRLLPVETRWFERKGKKYTFPAMLKALSVVGDTSPFQFLLQWVLEEGRIGNIDTLSVHAQFSPQDTGVREMLDVFQKLTSIQVIKLCPYYDPTSMDLDILRGPIYHWLRIRGLKRLEIDFSGAPAEWALNCLTFCAASLLTRGKTFDVDIRVPRSPELWDEQGPAAQLEQLLMEVDHDNPLARKSPKSALVVRDFPADLPDQVKAAPRVCKYPIVFVNVGV